MTGRHIRAAALRSYVGVAVSLVLVVGLTAGSPVQAGAQVEVGQSPVPAPEIVIIPAGPESIAGSGGPDEAAAAGQGSGEAAAGDPIVEVLEARTSHWWMDGWPHAPIDKFYGGQAIGHWGLVSSSDPDYWFSVEFDVVGPCGYHYHHWNSQYFFHGTTFWIGQRNQVPWDACPGTYTFTFTAHGSDGTPSAQTQYEVVSDSPPGGVSYGQLFGANTDVWQAIHPQQHAVNPSGTLSDPVNSATGAFTHAELDASVPAIGIGFSFARAYNSADPSVGPYSAGWSHSYDAKLLFVGGGDVIFHAGGGQQIYYTRQPDGSLVGDPGVRSLLVENPDGTFTLTSKDQTTYEFAPTGELLAMSDRNGQGLTFGYNPEGRLESVSGSGRQHTLGYDPAGRLAQLTLNDGRTVTYQYTGGLLTGVVDLTGELTSYTYDAGGRLASIQDANDHFVVRNTYDPATGRVTEQLDALGELSTFSWDPATQTATMVDPNGGVWRDVYQDNVLIARIDPLGNETRYSWDEDFNLVRFTNPNHHTTTMAHNAAGNLIRRSSDISIGNYEEQFSWNGRNDVTSDNDAANKVSYFGYDPVGNLTQISRGGLSSTITYDPAGTGLVTAITDPADKTVAFQYDSQGNLLSATSPLGHTVSYTYDAAGRVTSRVDPRGNEPGANPDDYRTTFEYNDFDQVVQVTDPLGGVTTAIYDPVGNLAGVTDPLERIHSIEYDAANHPVLMTDPEAGTVSWTYDPNGNLATSTNPRDVTTTYGYDLANRLTSVTGPLGTATFGYDPAGMMTSVTDPGDVTATMVYDTAGRLTSINYSDGTPGASFGYDANGNRTTMNDSLATTYYTYDDSDRITRVQRGWDIFDYQYDQASNLISRTTPGIGTETFGYDDDHRLTSVSNGANIQATYSYDPAGRLITTTLPSSNGHTELRSYDPAGRLVEILNQEGSNVLSSVSYGRDAVGNPTRTTDETGTVTTYEYDQLNRLVAACFDTGTCVGATDYVHWAYDPASNRTTETRPSGTTSYTYNDADQLISRSGAGGSATYTYDPRGNLLDDGDTTYTYDAASHMTSAQQGRTTTTYTYDGEGRRLTAATGSQARKNTQYLWDPLTYLLVGELDGNGDLLRSYTQGLDLVAMNTKGKDYYYHRDGLGSITEITDANGTAQWQYRYEPYGSFLIEDKLKNKAPANYFTYTGEYQDPTGLHHLRARQYDPQTGRFLSPEPLGTGNSYQYAAANPMVYTDPTGLFPCLNGIDDFLGCVKAAAGVVGVLGAVACPFTGAGCGVAYYSAAVYTGISAAQAWDVCTGGTKGSCGWAVVETSLGLFAGRYAAAATSRSTAARSAVAATDDLARPALPGGATLTRERLDHIALRHWPTSGATGVGRFAPGTTGSSLTTMIDDAVRNGSFRPNTGGRLGTIFEYDFGTSIGTNIGGNATSRLRVVVDPNGNVITAFPY